MTKADLLKTLNLPDAFLGFVPRPGAELKGWNGGEKVLLPLIGERRPKLIVEVGAWLGLSTMVLARSLQATQNTDCAVLSIDTWLGSLEHWQAGNEHFVLEHGHPTLYWLYLSNVVNYGCSDLVVPLPLTSQIAARFIKSKNLEPDLVYLDASHDEKDIYDDLVAYCKLLAPGGAMVGDDYQWPSVRGAVDRFCAEHGLTPTLTQDTYTTYWTLTKQV